MIRFPRTSQLITWRHRTEDGLQRKKSWGLTGGTPNWVAWAAAREVEAQRSGEGSYIRKLVVTGVVRECYRGSTYGYSSRQLVCEESVVMEDGICCERCDDAEWEPYASKIRNSIEK